MIEEGTRMRATVIAISMLMALGGVLAMIPMDEMSATAAQIPATINGDWTVSTDEEYDGGSCVLTGNLIVDGTGNLTLRNLTLALNNGNDGEFRIDVYNGGTLWLYNVTIKSNTAFQGNSLTSQGTLYVKDSTISNFGLLWWWSGVNVWNGKATFLDSTFSNNDIGIYSSGITPIIENCTFTNNLETGLMLDMSSPTVKNSTFTNNGQAGGGGWGGAVSVMWNSMPTFYDCTVTGNKVDGFYVEEGSADVYNSVIMNNNPNDVRVESWGTSTEVNLINTTFAKSAIDQWGMGGNSKLNVYWWVNVTAKWESDDGPVDGGDLLISDTNELEVFSEMLDQDGEYFLVKVKEYEEKSTGKTLFTPHTINVTGNRDGKERTNETTLSISQCEDVLFYLDDVPPGLSITSPEEGFATNLTNITVDGVTDPGAWAWINDVFAIVNGVGSFSLDHVDLPVEGVNKIVVKARDLAGNEAQAEVNVTRDTIVPDLTLDQPLDDSLFNFTSIDVSGTTEFGANLTINGDPVTVEADGTYSTTLELDEGENDIVAVSVDPVGNTATVKVTIEIDITPPILSLTTPDDLFRTRDPSVQVMGATEPKALVTCNGGPVMLSGALFSTQVNLVEGENTITVRSCDIAGNCVEASVTGIMDSTPPVLTVTDPPTTEEVLTNQEEYTLVGVTEPGAVVTVQGKAADVEDDGTWSLTMALREGSNPFTIRAEDDLGNSIQQSRKVKRDTVAPNIEVTSPEDGLRTGETNIRLEGLVEAGAGLKCNDAIVSFSGATFTKMVALDTEGENVFKCTATDAAGNQASSEITIVRDTIIILEIESPTDGLVTKEENVTLKGRTDPGASVLINDTSLVADDEGRFELLMELAIGETEIKVLVRDDVGNEQEMTIKVTRQKKKVTPPPGPIPGGSDLGGMMFPLLLVIVIIIVVVVVLVAMKKRKGKAAEAAPTPETQPEQLPQQQQPQQPYQQQAYDPSQGIVDPYQQQPPSQPYDRPGNHYGRYDLPPPPPPPPPPRPPPPPSSY